MPAKGRENKQLGSHDSLSREATCFFFCAGSRAWPATVPMLELCDRRRLGLLGIICVDMPSPRLATLGGGSPCLANSTIEEEKVASVLPFVKEIDLARGDIQMQ